MFIIMFIIIFMVGLFVNIWYFFMDYSIDNLFFISTFLIIWLFFTLISFLPLVFWKRIIWTIISYRIGKNWMPNMTPVWRWRKYTFNYEVEWNFLEKKIMKWNLKYYSITPYKEGSKWIFILYDDIFFVKRDLFYFLYFWFIFLLTIFLILTWVLK